MGIWKESFLPFKDRPKNNSHLRKWHFTWRQVHILLKTIQSQDCVPGHFLQERIAVLPSRERLTAKFLRMGLKTYINCFYGNVQPQRSITAGKLVDIRWPKDIITWSYELSETSCWSSEISESLPDVTLVPDTLQSTFSHSVLSQPCRMPQDKSTFFLLHPSCTYRRGKPPPFPLYGETEQDLPCRMQALGSLYGFL